MRVVEKWDELQPESMGTLARRLSRFVPLGVFFLAAVIFIFYFFHFFSLGFFALFLNLDAIMLIIGENSLYYFSSSERDARAFAKEAIKNEEWLKIVKVEDIDTP